MESNRDIVLNKQKRRYRLLVELWRTASEKELERVHFYDVAAKVGFDKDEAKEIYIYFMKEQFFEVRDHQQVHS